MSLTKTYSGKEFIGPDGTVIGVVLSGRRIGHANDIEFIIREV